MTKAYLIGGAPRVGKTTLALECIKKKPMLATSSDALRYTLRTVLSKDHVPDLFENEKYRTGNPRISDQLDSFIDKIIYFQNKESTIVWESVVNFIKSNLEDGNDVLVEGIAILPEFLMKVDFEYTAIFLGNHSESHLNTMLTSAVNNEHDWLNKRDDAGKKASFLFNQSYSKFIKNQAEFYNMKYLELNDQNFKKSLQEAADYLIK